MARLPLRLTVAALVLCGCNSTAPTEGPLSRQEFLLHRAQWQSHHPHDYTFDLDIQAMALRPPVRIEVRGDAVYRVVDRETGAELDPTANWPTIDGLFSQIEQLLDSPTARGTVSYDARLGYPTRIVSTPLVADVGFTETVTNLH
jgi:hypothetical protein